ncbi:uncharacterized protein BYT42DRAFT_566595 [Radiomyces spectabilis]|uniref:uncharacterized protein n=1 Tax=Radiomyces spectabilis TaxID=64574 RepID=UPI00221FC37A|nr:uncharacterized protein BYT42DRAFT_566595 [Radiomyces spectabilis]KAI8381461.1 hypothetical protein BYT42DRAFT_566595 [Radiomyces spectabilis]
MEANENSPPTTSPLRTDSSTPVHDIQKPVLAMPGKENAMDVNNVLQSPLRTVTNRVQSKSFQVYDAKVMLLSQIHTTHWAKVELQKSTKSVETRQTKAVIAPPRDRPVSVSPAPEMLRRSPVAKTSTTRLMLSEHKYQERDHGHATKLDTEKAAYVKPVPSLKKLADETGKEKLWQQVQQAKREAADLSARLKASRASTADMRRTSSRYDRELEELKAKATDSTSDQSITTEKCDQIKKQIGNLEEEIAENEGILEELSEVLEGLAEEETMPADGEERLQAKEDEIDQLMNLIPTLQYQVKELRSAS